MYVKIENGQIAAYPYTVGQLRKDNPNTSFPKNIPESTLAMFDMYPVVKSQESYDEETQMRVWDNLPSLVGDKWVLGCTVSDLPQETIDQRVAAKLASKVKLFTDATQKYLDDEAKTRGYDGIMSLCTYATSTNTRFKAEGQAGVEFRDAVWDFAHTALGDWQSGAPEPTMEEYLVALPDMMWPAV